MRFCYTNGLRGQVSPTAEWAASVRWLSSPSPQVMDGLWTFGRGGQTPSSFIGKQDGEIDYFCVLNGFDEVLLLSKGRLCIQTLNIC